MKVEIRKPSQDEVEKLGIKNWPVWTSPIQTFPWEYDDTETCYFIKGRVIVETEDRQSIEIKAGDLVTFPAGLKCTWKVLEPVEKHYKFGS